MYSEVCDFEKLVTQREPLSGHTTLRVGGPARWLGRPKNTAQLGSLVRWSRKQKVNLYPLGLGANLLISDDGVDGMVLRLGTASFKEVHWPKRDAASSNRPSPLCTQGGVLVTAGAGADMHRLVLESVRRGLRGLEVLAGIPGTLGGIIRMNAGGKWGQIADVVRVVTVVDREGDVRELTPDEVGFAYRRTLLKGAIICQAKLELIPEDPAVLRERFRDIWSSKKASQPLAEPSAGCVFKNPPSGPSAGSLIERAGLKGRRVGGARVSELHANFIVTQEGATAADVFELIDQIRGEVARRSGVELEMEIQVWGRQRGRLTESMT